MLQQEPELVQLLLPAVALHTERSPYYPVSVVNKSRCMRLFLQRGWLFYKILTLKKYLVTISKWGAFIEACYDIFFNEIIEYVITNEEPARF